ncbi:MAG: serine/threonine protein kinase [Cyanobacteria bacterium REEB67]|nr:serine/threonine protein kinase [Cyanobacteria bacterium REEB67]
MSDQEITKIMASARASHIAHGRSRRKGQTLSELPPPGALVAERWELIEHIGEGGMSEVYRARHVIMHKSGAVKFLKGALASDPNAVKRFQQEAIASGSLSHPNIVQVHDCGISAYGAYLILEYLEGVSLTEVLEARAGETNNVGVSGALRFDEAIPVFLDICDGLEHAHKKGIVHRDIKPSNVMLVEPEVAKTGHPDEVQAKLVDFGIAKMLGLDGTASDGELTRTGEVFGSPLYMSPEQCLGRPLDGRADIYSLGMLMYESLTGTKLLMAANSTATMMRHIDEEADVSFLASLKDPLARPLSEIVARCTRRDPDERYSDVNALRVALLRLKATFEKPATRREQAASSSLKWLVLAGSLVILVLCLAGGAFFFAESAPAGLNSSTSVGVVPLAMPLKMTHVSVPTGMVSARVFDGGEGVLQRIEISPERKLVDGQKTLNKAFQLLSEGRYEDAHLRFDFVANLLRPIRLGYAAVNGPLLRAEVGSLQAKCANMYWDALDISLGELIMSSPSYYSAPSDAKIFALNARARAQLAHNSWAAAAATIAESLKLYPNSPPPTPDEIVEKAVWTGLLADLLRLTDKTNASAGLDEYKSCLACLDRAYISDADYARAVTKFRAELYYRYGLALIHAERFSEARDAFDRCLSLFKKVGDDMAPEISASRLQIYLCLKHTDRLESLKYRLKNHL